MQFYFTWLFLHGLLEQVAVIHKMNNLYRGALTITRLIFSTSQGVYSHRIVKHLNKSSLTYDVFHVIFIPLWLVYYQVVIECCRKAGRGMFVLWVIDRRKLRFSFISLPPFHCELVKFRKNESKKATPKRNGPRLQLGKLVDLTWTPALGVWGVCCLRALSYLNENQYYMCQCFTRKKCPETRQSGGKGRMNWGEDGGVISHLGCGS